MNMPPTDNSVELTCWKQTGVAGDGSCPKLAELGHCRHCPEYARAGRNLFDRDIPAGFREEWTQTLAGGKETEIPGAVSVVVFRLHDELLALKTEAFVRALEVRPIHRVPFRTNRVFLGLVNVDGVLLPAVAALEILGIAAPAARPPAAEQGHYQRLMVVVRDGARWVFPVDEVLGVYHIVPNQFQNPPQTISKSQHAFTSRVFALADRTVGLLDDAKLFDSFQGSLTH
jgi:chemotaxis-related protein WspD